MGQYRMGGFQMMPPAVKNLLIINVVVYLISNFMGQAVQLFMYSNFSLFHWSSPHFKIWQFVTHMFMHAPFNGGGISHILFNMLALWMFGNTVENYLGTKRFLIYYFICGIGAAVCFLLTKSLMGGVNPNEPMMGASGAIFGLLFAFGYLYPNMTVYVQLLFPMKAKYFVGIYGLIELIMGVYNGAGDNVAHFAHLGGMLFGFIMFKIWNIKSNKYVS